MIEKIKTAVVIDAPLSEVWKYLTDPSLMRKWMGESEMNVEVITDWKVGEPILIKGFHHVQFQNKGTILKFAPPRLLQYTHFSSISHLPESEENYTVITFLLSPSEKGTSLRIEAENFPTQSTYKHLDFYWRGTVNVLKELIEQREIKNLSL